MTSCHCLQFFVLASYTCSATTCVLRCLCVSSFWCHFSNEFFTSWARIPSVTLFACLQNQVPTVDPEQQPLESFFSSFLSSFKVVGATIKALRSWAWLWRSADVLFLSSVFLGVSCLLHNFKDWSSLTWFCRTSFAFAVKILLWSAAGSVAIFAYFLE